MKRLILLLSLFLIAGSAPSATAQYSELMGRVPKDANTVVLLNAEKIFSSPVAREGRWQQRRQAAFEAGVSALPPQASAVVMAARTDFEFGKSVWELSMLRSPDGVQIGEVANRFGGTVDSIEEKFAARLPGDHYLVQISDRVLAAHTPANRQDVARWLRGTDLSDPTDRHSGYLREAYRYATEVGTPLIMALDLEQVASEATVAERLGRSTTWNGSEEETRAAAKLIAGVEGVTLGVTFGEAVRGSIRVDFSQSPDPLKEVGKGLLIETLEKHGSMIEDFRDWSPSVRENTLLLSGQLSAEGLRRLLSVLELPASLAEAVDRVKLSQDDSPESLTRAASQQYYRSLVVLLDDLRTKGKRDGVKTFGQAAIWYGKYARKIDDLPLLNVDPVLVDFGRQTSDRLRDAEMAMKGVGMRTSVRTSGNNAGYVDGDYGYGGYRSYYGGYGTPYSSNVTTNFNVARSAVRAEQQADNVVRTQERVSGAAAVQQIWAEIDRASAEIRRDLTAKYQVEF